MGKSISNSRTSRRASAITVAMTMLLECALAMPARAQMHLDLNEPIELQEKSDSGTRQEPEPTLKKTETAASEQEQPDSVSQSGQTKIQPGDTASGDDSDTPADTVTESGDMSSAEGPFTVPEMPSTLSVLSQARGSAVTFLKGKVTTSTRSRTPILVGSIQTVPEKTKIDLVLPEGQFIHSELSQKGDEVRVRIARDVKGEDGKVLLPGGWYARGLITKVKSQRRGGRDGYVEIEFDKIVSPDKEYELDFNARFSTKDHKLKSAAKLIAIDSGYVGAGAFAGALISLQLTGVAGAVATEGYSVAIGAGVGASIGLFAALKRKGKIAYYTGGDSLKLVTAEGITMPEFDPEALPSAKPAAKLAGLTVKVNQFKFRKNHWGDRKAKLLDLDLSVINKSRRKFHFFDLAVVSDHQVSYSPALSMHGRMPKAIPPNASGQGKMTFLVGSKKRKYFLVFHKRGSSEELTRVPINK